MRRTIDLINNKFQCHTWELRSRCCKAEFYSSEPDFEEEICSKCNKYCEVDYTELDIKIPIRLPIDRNGLATLFAELGFKKGAEIGIERGKYSEVLCKSIPNLCLTCVDPLIPYGDYRGHVTKERMDEFYMDAIRRLSKYHTHIIREFSMDALKEIEPESLDFVYIDANHDFQNTTNDVIEWGKKVKSGGIIAGHDYTNFVKEHNRCDVKYVMDAYVQAYNIPILFKTNEKTSPSWFYVKE